MEGPDIQEARILDYSVSHKKWIAHASSLSIDGSPTSNPPSFNIATWNIWEDDRATKYRYPYILHLLFGSSSPFDVITLQEVTGEFSTALLQHRTVQRDWLVTDLTHQLELLPNPYGTMILVKKSRFQGYTFKARFHAFESSYMARGLNFIEVYRNVAPSPGRNPSRQLIMRIGTAHFESHPDDLRKRKAQFETSANILTSSSSATVPAILTGDCNITSYAELTPLINPTQGRPTFVDALLTPRPLRSDQDPFRSHPTMGLTLPNVRTFGIRRQNKPAPVRLDYIFTHKMGVSNNRSHSGFLGGEPCCGKEKAKMEEGKDGRVYASDHLGVWVKATLVD